MRREHCSGRPRPEPLCYRFLAMNECTNAKRRISLYSAGFNQIALCEASSLHTLMLSPPGDEIYKCYVLRAMNTCAKSDAPVFRRL